MATSSKETLEIFEEVSKMVEQKTLAQFDKKKIGTLGRDLDRNDNPFDLLNDDETRHIDPRRATLRLNAMKSLVDKSELIASYFRSSCWKIPLTSVTFHCYLVQDFKRNRKSNYTLPLYTLYLDVGPYNHIRKFLISGRRLTKRSNIYRFGSDPVCRLDTKGFCVAELERDPSQDIFHLYDNGLDSTQVLQKLGDEEERGKSGTLKIRKNLESIYFMKQKGRTATCWQSGREPKFNCTTLTPRIPSNANFSIDPDDLDILDQPKFSRMDWTTETGNLNNCEKLNGEKKRIYLYANGSNGFTQQLLLNRCNLARFPEEVFALTKLNTTRYERRYLLRFATPLSICHAFGIAISSIESGF